MKSFIGVILIFITLNSLLLNCSSETPTSSNLNDEEIKIKINLPPHVSELSLSSDTINIDELQVITCIANDPDNDSLSYFWESFKLTENSTQEDYEIIFFINRGDFLETGDIATWQPGRLDGKYLIICTVRDIAGYEVSKIKLINVVLNQTLNAKTDKLFYNHTDTLNLTITNDKYNLTYFDGCSYFITCHVERKNDDNSWTDLTKDIFCAIDRTQVEIGLNDIYSDNLFLNLVFWEEKGIYRLYFQYSINDWDEQDLLILYSNEFEIR